MQISKDGSVTVLPFLVDVTKGTRVVRTLLTVPLSSCKSATGVVLLACVFGTKLSLLSICLLILLAIFMHSQIVSMLAGRGPNYRGVLLAPSKATQKEE